MEPAPKGEVEDEENTLSFTPIRRRYLAKRCLAIDGVVYDLFFRGDSKKLMAEEAKVDGPTTYRTEISL